jgi:hypothetical protein
MSLERIDKAILALPDHIQPGIVAYLHQGRPTGGFLAALLEGDLELAKALSDHQNFIAWSKGLYRELLAALPASCHGSKEKRLAWIAGGGLDGERGDP